MTIQTLIIACQMLQVRGCSDEDLKLLQHHIETARHHAEQICQTLQLPSSLRPCVLHIYRAASEITGVEELRLLQAQLSTLFPNEDLGTNAAASEVHMIPELSLGDVLDRSLLPQQEQELNVPRQVRPPLSPLSQLLVVRRSASQ